MISNDWGRLIRLQEELNGRHPGAAMLMYRLQLGLHLEAAKFMNQAQRQYENEVSGFLSSVPKEAQDLHRELTDPESLAQLRAQQVRDLSFHYPQIHRERYDRRIEEMAKLLTAAEGIEGAAEMSDIPEFLEYRFADEIVLQMLPQNEGGDLDTDAIAAFKNRALGFRRFAELVINQYLDGQPSDDLRVIPRRI